MAGVSGGRPRRRAAGILAVAVPVAVSAGCCFAGLGSRSIWLDESASITIASQHGTALGRAMAHDGGNLLAFYALLHVLFGWFGDGVDVARAPAAVGAVLAVALVSVLGRRWYSDRVALAAGLLAAVSLPLVYWGQDARGYAPLVALVTGSTLALDVASERLEAGTRAGPALALYGAVTTLAVYTSFVAALVVPAQLLALVAARRRVRPLLLVAVVAGACCVPLAVLAHARGSGQLFWVPRPSWSTLRGVLDTLTAAAFAPNFRRSATSTPLLGVTLALLAAAVVQSLRVRSLWVRSLRVRSLRVRSPEPGPRPARPGRDPGGNGAAGTGAGRLAEPLLVSWLVVPIALALAESAVGQSIFEPRNLLVAYPPVALLLAALALGPLAPARLAPAAGWSVVAALLAFRALQLAPSYGVSPENWRAATAAVLARVEPGECVAFYPEDGRMAFDYYLRAAGATVRAPRPVLPATPWRTVEPFVERYATLGPAAVEALHVSCKQLVLVASHEGEATGTAGTVAHYERYRALEGRLALAYGVPTVRSYGYAAAVTVLRYGG